VALLDACQGRVSGRSYGGECSGSCALPGHITAPDTGRRPAPPETFDEQGATLVRQHSPSATVRAMLASDEAHTPTSGNYRRQYKAAEAGGFLASVLWYYLETLSDRVRLHVMEVAAMIWQKDAHGQRWRMQLDGWRAIVQQAQGRQRWRAAVTPAQSGIARLAPAVFTSRIAAQIWCISVIRRHHQEEAVSSSQSPRR